jgi:hypothetical protein
MPISRIVVSTPSRSTWIVSPSTTRVTLAATSVPAGGIPAPGEPVWSTGVTRSQAARRADAAASATIQPRELIAETLP